MINVVDDDGALGNLSDLTKSLNEEAASLTGAAKEQKADPGKDNQQNTGNDDAVDIPDKFKGKSVKEIVDSYKNLESQLGRMANDLGQQRHLTDRLLNLKRENDLSQNGATKVTTPQIKATDLAENPTAAIKQVVDATIAERDTKSAQDNAELARQQAAQRLVRDHPDYQNFVNNNEFNTWLQASPIRARAAARAQAGDFDEGNDLLTEFKSYKASTTVNQKDEEAKRLEAANNASLESGARGGSSGQRGAGKIYNRADLLRLQMEKPDLYYSDEYQAVILKAYAEKRVK